jgi:hypothetical protein
MNWLKTYYVKVALMLSYRYTSTYHTYAWCDDSSIPRLLPILGTVKSLGINLTAAHQFLIYFPLILLISSINQIGSRECQIVCNHCH